MQIHEYGLSRINSWSGKRNQYSKRDVKDHHVHLDRAVEFVFSEVISEDNGGQVIDSGQGLIHFEIDRSDDPDIPTEPVIRSFDTQHHPGAGAPRTARIFPDRKQVNNIQSCDIAGFGIIDRLGYIPGFSHGFKIDRFYEIFRWGYYGGNSRRLIFDIGTADGGCRISAAGITSDSDYLSESYIREMDED